jgi:cold shock CspA family protein
MRRGDRKSDVFQRDEGLRFHPADDGSKDVFVHMSEAEKAGLTGAALAVGAKVSFDIVSKPWQGIGPES